MNKRRIPSILLLAAAGCSLAGIAAPQPPSAPPASLTSSMISDFAGIKHVTRPSRDATIGFAQPTRLTEVLVAGGATVKAGQILVRGEDAEELARLKLQKIRADSDLSVKKAEKARDLAQLEFEKTKLAAGTGVASSQELDRSRLTAEGADLDLGIAKMNQDQEVLAVEMGQARVDRLLIKAPFDGQVDVVLADVGQSVSESDKVVRVVNVDPLWIDVPAPTAKTLELGLKLGDACWVLMDLPGPAEVHKGKIIEVSPVADSASATRRIRVEISNPRKLVAGVSSWVRFEEPIGQWKEKVVESGRAARLENSR